MDLLAGKRGSTRGRTPDRPGQHAESSFLWELHQEFPLAKVQVDGGEAGEDIRAVRPEGVRGRQRTLHVPGAGVQEAPGPLEGLDQLYRRY